MSDLSLPFPFIFLRHGETDWNLERRIMGSTDIPLNDTGRAQAAEGAARLAGLGVATIWASPLSRTRETAEIVASHFGLDVTLLDGLKERDWGIYEGRLASERPTDRRAAPEGGESQDAFQQRSIQALSTVTGPRTLVVVAHSGTWRALCNYMEWSFEGPVANSMPYFVEASGYSPL